MFLYLPLRKKNSSQLQFLSAKPLVYVANVTESQLAKPDENKHVVVLKKKAQEEGRPAVVISAQIESELSVLKFCRKNELFGKFGCSLTLG